MVNPISANVGQQHYVVPATDLERPASIPEPAVQVTTSSETLGSGSSTSTRQQREQSESNTPLDKALEQVNENMKAWDTGMRFDLDTEAERMVVSIIDSATGEVLRTIPNEAVIRVAKMIVQLQGNLVNTKA